jgi:hypothetical protein
MVRQPGQGGVEETGRAGQERSNSRKPLASRRGTAFLPCMSPPAKPSASPFTPAERAWLRQELGVHFGAGPQIADGLFLRSWKSGPEKGKPKMPPAARSMLDRGLIEIRPGRIGYSAFLTEAGLAALRQLVLDARAMTQAGSGICGNSWACKRPSKV